MRCDRKRFAKKYNGNQDLTNAFRYCGDNMPRMGMRVAMNDDGQNLYSWKNPDNTRFDKLIRIMERFIIKRVGKKFDDVYSEFINKHLKTKFGNACNDGKKHLNIKHQFIRFFNKNDYNISLEDGIIVKHKSNKEPKNNDIVIYGPYETVLTPLKRNWNAGRRVLLPLLGFHKFEFYSQNAITDDNRFIRLLKQNLTPDVIELLKTIEAFKDIDNKPWADPATLLC